MTNNINCISGEGKHVPLSLIKTWVKQTTKAIQSTVTAVPVDICYQLHQLEPRCPTVKKDLKKLKRPANGELIIDCPL